MKPLRDAAQTLRDCLAGMAASTPMPWYAWAGVSLLASLVALAGGGILLLACACCAGER